MNRKVLIASPGTGKTTTLLNIVQGLVSSGVHPSRIAFTTYTKSAADHARDEALKRFPQYEQKHFPYFRTLHSLAYRELGGPRLAETTRGFFQELVRATGTPCSFSGWSTLPKEDAKNLLGDLFLNLYNLARNTFQEAKVLALQNTRFKTLNFFEYEQFIKKYEMLKEFHQLNDFSGILRRFIDLKDINLPVDYLFIDEGQDCTNLQWDMIKKIESGGVTTSFVAGDDKQSIYEWAGANPRALIDLEGTREILGQSYRLKENIVQLSEKIAERIRIKSPYTIKAVSQGGQVHRIRSVEALDISKGSWLLLARLNKDLELYRQFCIRSGFKYSCSDDNQDEVFEAIRIWEMLRNGQWVEAGQVKKVMPFLPSGTVVARGKKTEFEEVDDRTSVSMEMMKSQYGILNSENWYEVFRLDSAYKEALRQMVKNEGETSAARIKIMTIHGSKGLEAENVVIDPHLSPSCRQTLMTNPDMEHRVFYVAITRAKDNAYILQRDGEDYQL